MGCCRDDGAAPGLVSAGVVGADRESHGERLDGREAEAVSDQSAIQTGGQSEVAAVLGMMAAACGRLRWPSLGRPCPTRRQWRAVCPLSDLIPSA
jgi:hypothetical protein